MQCTKTCFKDSVPHQVFVSLLLFHNHRTLQYLLLLLSSCCECVTVLVTSASGTNECSKEIRAGHYAPGAERSCPANVADVRRLPSDSIGKSKGGRGWMGRLDEKNTRRPRWQEWDEQGQSSREQTEWSNDSQRQTFGDISGYKRRSDDVHGLSSSTEAEICNPSIWTEMPGCKPALQRAGFDAAYCISGEALEIPSANIKAVLASLLPAAQRDIHKARNAII